MKVTVLLRRCSLGWYSCWCCLHHQGQSWETSLITSTACSALPTVIWPAAGCQDSPVLSKYRMVLRSDSAVYGVLYVIIKSIKWWKSTIKMILRTFLLIINNRMKYRILQNIEVVLTKYEDDVSRSPSSQGRSRRRKPGGGESPPGSTRSLQNLCGVQFGPCISWHVLSPSDQQDLDHYDEVLIFYNINPTVSPLSLIKLEQAWLYRLWFK